MVILLFKRLFLRFRIGEYGGERRGSPGVPDPSEKKSGISPGVSRTSAGFHIGAGLSARNSLNGF